MKKKVNDEHHQEIIEAVNKLQWVLGESIFRTQKLRTALTKNGEFEKEFSSDLNVLLRTLNKITQLYRHDIAEKIKSVVSK
jgi:hypothetical protein